MRIGITNLKRRREAFIADRRGAASFEVVIVSPVLLLLILFPMVDVGVAGFQFISARQALHAFGQSIVYAPPDDLADLSSWTPTTLEKAGDLDYPISNIQIICGDGGVVCSSTNLESPKYYSFNTTVTLAPMVLSSLLCSSSCTYTIFYSTRFQ